MWSTNVFFKELGNGTGLEHVASNGKWRWIMNWKGCGRSRYCTDVCWKGLRKDMKTLSEMSVSAAGFELGTHRTRYRTAIFGPSLWRTKQVNMVSGIHFWFTPWLLLPPGSASPDCKSDRVTLPSALLSATDGVYTPNIHHNRKRITEFHTTEVVTVTLRVWCLH